MNLNEHISRMKDLIKSQHGIIKPLVSEQEQQFTQPSTVSGVELSDDGSVVTFKPKSNNQLHFLYCNDMMGFKKNQIESNVTNEVVNFTDIGLSEQDVQAIAQWCNKPVQG